MVNFLGKPKPMPYVDENDLLLLAADIGPGVFRADELHTAYSASVRDEGREPVTKRAFGSALKQAGWTPIAKYKDGQQRRCWVVSKPWVRRGNEMLAAEMAAAKAQPQGHGG